MTAAERGWIHRDYFEEYATVPLITVRDKPGFLGCFYSIIEGGGDAIFKKALLMQLISVIISDNFPSVSEESPHLHTVHEIKEYIDAGNGLRMSLDDFARSFFQSKFYPERRFKEAFVVNLTEYRNRKRMEFAS